MGAMRQPPSTPTPRSRSSRPATAKRRPRPPGRPTAGDGDRREHVLDAALACYLQRGIAATSLRDISRQAGVTPALLHYYFDAAAGLRDAVVAERVLPVFGQAQAVLLDMRDAPLRQTLEAFVDCICGLVARHPWLPSLWIREVVSEGGELRDLLTTGLMRELAAAGHMVIVVLHDLALAARWADHMIVLSKGTCAAQGRPADILNADLLAKIYGVSARVGLWQGSLHIAVDQPV